MSKLYRFFALASITVLVVSCTAPTIDQPTQPATAQLELPTLPEVSIVRYPDTADFSEANVYTQPPVFDRQAEEFLPIDLRSSDLSRLDLSNSAFDLTHADFDSRTQWPPTDKMPYGFDPQKIMELNKDPGLGIRDLHQQGINGTGIAIAIIDQPLLVEHVEYKDRIRLYEEIDIIPGTKATMHGAAVSSIAVGKTVGIAPQADLYYIGAWTGDWGTGANGFTWNFAYYAQAVRRILEINQSLPDKQKIRVIAMQVGWHPDQNGYDDIMNAVDEAKTQGVFVISSSLRDTHGLNFHGLGKTPLADPNDFWSYQPGSWWEQNFFKTGSLSNTLLIPMDSRTTASPTGTEEYVFYRQGGWSWAIPYIAGMYALAAQVNPDITPDVFWESALATGRTIHLSHNGRDHEFGVILDPQALIEAIQSK